MQINMISPFVSVSKFLANNSFSSFINFTKDGSNASLVSRVDSSNWIENWNDRKLLSQWVFNIFSPFVDSLLHKGITQRNFLNYFRPLKHPNAPTFHTALFEAPNAHKGVILPTLRNISLERSVSPEKGDRESIIWGLCHWQSIHYFFRSS